ncbi:hypothetical protein Ciccas_009179 [Cichlidogyrus casuarinus]|uniref:DnaJ homolog subfamily C member 2 n=1 Tax=Cichlidogyrus casuarinus TaxID=1844966 RepID=A0ABD2PXT5_9PLAT
MKKNFQVVVYDVHPQVTLVRDFIGYSDRYTVLEKEAESNFETDLAYLRSLDPVNWRENDHYAVLGLGKQRFRASDDDIRKACNLSIEVYILVAFEILGNTSRRFAFDCVDEISIDDSLPTVEEVKEDFFLHLRPAFQRNARWSKHQPLPDLGSHSSTFVEVEHFYSKWENFETIRDFSYLDEEEKDKGENRDHRRYIDKQNKGERAKRRAADTKRIRTLVEMARSHDPRLKAEQERLKREKEAKKAAKVEMVRQQQEEKLARIRMEQEIVERQRQEAEDEKRVTAERVKKERETEKAFLKDQRKRLKKNVFETNCYFNVDKLPTDSHEFEDHKIEITHEVEILCHALSGLELANFAEKLENLVSAEQKRELLKQEVDAHKKASVKETLKTADAAENGNASCATSKWSLEATQALIKAINLFPAGTNKRWEVIAQFVNQLIPGGGFSSREVLRHAKSLSSDDSNVKQETNSKAYENFSSSVKKSECCAEITTAIEAESIRPWTSEEQKILEKALKTVTPSTLLPSEDRWQKIADLVGTRTRKECMLRFKMLAEQVKAKKAAISATEAKFSR